MNAYITSYQPDDLAQLVQLAEYTEKHLDAINARLKGRQVEILTDYTGHGSGHRKSLKGTIQTITHGTIHMEEVYVFLKGYRYSIPAKDIRLVTIEEIEALTTVQI